MKTEKAAPVSVTAQKTRADKVNADLVALLKARNTLIWIVSREENRVEDALSAIAEATSFGIRFWDCATGVTNKSGEVLEATKDAGEVIGQLRDLKNRGPDRMIYVLRDMHKWLDAMNVRALRSTAHELKGADKPEARAMVILSPSNEIPPELANSAVVIEYPLPDRSEVAKIVDGILETYPDAAPNGVKDAAVDAAVGLTADEASNCLYKSLVTAKGKLEPTAIAAEKKRVIARERVLTWHDPEPRGLDAIGGLDVLKSWLLQRRAAFGPRARAYGLPSPRGMFLAGLPGNGKSLISKAVATAFGMPLLRLDMGAVKSKFVGESEQNIRKALAVAETISPCVLWLDEIEKALAGSTGPQGDGGVAADALGTILSWMQERQGAVFVVATANDVRSLPPELLRKGRFDEVFWIDTPNDRERPQVLAAALKQYGRDPEAIDLAALVPVTQGYSGAEIAALVPDAMYRAFADGERAISTDDLVEAAKGVIPLATTAKEKLDQLREWAKNRARPASTPTETAARTGRAIDL